MNIWDTITYYYNKHKAEVKLIVPVLFFVIMGVFLIKACLKDKPKHQPTINEQVQTLQKQIQENDKKIDSLKHANYIDNLHRAGIITE